MILAARDLTLWAIAALATAHALLAWPALPVPAVGGLCLLEALAVAAAAPMGTRLLAGLDAFGRGRVRVLLGVAHAAVVMLLPVAAGAAPPLLPRAALLLAWLQVPTLLLSTSESGLVASLMNATALVALTALHGGLPAASAVMCFVGSLAGLLVVDHWARMLAAYPHTRAPGSGVVVRNAFKLVLPVAMGTSLVFLVHPPRPAESVLVAVRQGIRAEPLGAAHRFLLLALLLGGGGILAVVRIFRHKSASAAPTTEALEVLTLSDETLPIAPPEAAVPYTGARGRVLRAYLRFLAEAARRVVRRHPHETPREFARRVGEPARAVGTLSELFMVARYGAGEPSDTEAAAAEQAESEIRAAFRGRSRSTRAR